MTDRFSVFGWPATKVAELGHWCVMLRPAQPTLGSLVLACKEPVEAFGNVSSEGHAELGEAVKRIEAMLSAAFNYDKINYLMLMMVDPFVHFHVIPRYAAPRCYQDIEVFDAGWPGPPALGQAVPLSDLQVADLAATLRDHWDA
jgi:diadenosine tetraphosphate (Ap4A) HIT family hydrolase